MPEPVSIQCPECGVKLKLKDRTGLGKKANCPKCSTVFTAKPVKSAAKPTATRPKKSRPKPAPVDDYDDFDEFDELDDFGDDFGDEFDDDFEQPASRSRGRQTGGGSRSRTRGKSAGKKARGKGKGGIPKPVIIGGAVAVGLAFLIGAGFLISSLFGGGNRIDLSYLPNDLDAVFRVQVGKIWNSPFLNDVVTTPEIQQAVSQATEQLGIAPADIESVTVGMWGLQPDSAQSSTGLPFGARPPGGGQPDVLTVVRLSKPVDVGNLAGKMNAQTAEHGGQKFYQTPGMGGQAVWAADGNLLVIGQETHVKAAIDRGASQQRRKDLDFIDNSHHVVIAICPHNAQSKERGTTGGRAMDNIPASFDRNVQAGSLGITFGSDVEIEFQAKCFGSGQAEQLNTDLTAALSEIRGQMAQVQGSVPEPFRPLSEIGNQILGGISVSQSGSLVSVNGTIPGSVKQTFKDTLANSQGSMAGMMLQNALNSALSDLPSFGSPGGSPATPGGPPGIPGSPSQPPPGFPGGPPPGFPSSSGSGSGNPLTGTLNRAQLLRVTNNLKQIALAMHNHHDAYRKFPAPYTKDGNGQPLLSWRVHILPFLNHQALYDQFRLNEPWNSPHNMRLVNAMPPVFGESPSGKAGHTTIALAHGAGACFQNGEPSALRDITDGTSNTIMIVQIQDSLAVPWTQPDAFSVDVNNPAAGLSTAYGGKVPVALADGSTPSLDVSNTNRLKALFTRAGGEVVGAF